MELSRIRGQAPAPSNHLVQLMRQHPLLFYFLLAYGLSWACELLVFGVLRLPLEWIWPFTLVTLVGPTMAGFLMTAVTQGRAGIVQLLRRFVLWRVGIRWYLVALLGVPALELLLVLIQPGAFSAFRLPGLSVWLTYLIAYLTTLPGGALMEEGGWRGFALPRMEQRSGPLVGTLLLGVLWWLWYLPLFLLVPGYEPVGTGLVGILSFLGSVVIWITALSFVFTWVFNNTRGSILLAMLLHASWDTAITIAALRLLLFPSLKMSGLYGLGLLLTEIVVAGVIIAATRGRLSYQRYLRETALPAPLTDQELEQEEVHMSV